MTKWLKRIRGVLGMGVTWAAVWAGFGALFVVSMGQGVGPGGIRVAVWALSGLLGGAGFALVLGLAGRRRTFEEMSIPLFSAGGALAGLFVLGAASEVGITSFSVGNAILLALLGAGSAAGTLALARKAEDRELLDAGGDVAEVGLTEAEKVELLGK